MTSPSTTAAPADPSTPTTPSSPTVLARTLRAEWQRLWTVRTTWLFAAAALLGTTAMALLAGHDARGVGQTRPGETVWEGAQIMALLGLFVLLATAAVSTTADHATGGIVPTLQWTPRRAVLLTARTGVVAVTTTVLGVALALLAGVVLHAMAGQLALSVDEGTDTLLAVAYVDASGALLAIGLGLLLRSTAGAVVAALALMLVLPLLLGNFPFAWAQQVADVLPGTSAIQLVVGEGPAGHSTADARMILAGWALAALALGWARLLRSDADR
ncbi:ABC transporter permease subunit [Nocardioides caeni]|uniref:ABC transporter permease n=1 Tax=Nocardioides caeni TaxID=574700 RepID=A0A4S8N2C5_9ACTN|nr:ABC transporter permease subunit [Nocardioides caeni]THV10067.1 hypothetical protein E9934_14720 [Nocardioides caeni]